MFQYTSDPKFDHPSFQNPVGFVKTPSMDDTDIFTFEPILDRDAESAWHKALPKYEQIPELALPDDSSPGSIDLEGSDSWIDFNFSNFEGLLDRDRNQLRSVSQPCTPRTRPSRSIKKALSFNNRSFIRKSPRPSRNSSVEPTARMRQASYYRPRVSNIKPANTDSAESLYIPACSNAMTSLPSASTINRTENGRGSFPQNHQPYPNIYPAFHDNELHVNDADYLSRQPMPQTPHAVEAWRNRENYAGENWNMAYSVPESSAALSALHTPPSSLSLPATRWGFDTSPKSEFAFSALSNYPVAVPMANSWDGDPARHYSYSESRSPRTGQNIGSVSEAINGLGISSNAMYYGDVELVGTEIEVGEETPRLSASPCEIESFGALQTTPRQHQALPLGQYSPSRSPSPYPQPQFHRRRSSSHVHSSHRNRRQSSSSSLLQWKQSDSDNANMSFVNFTPDDKKKILTGVAPSGSSKTKARREKEAADKRRRLSQAAVKAVIEAGGDIGSLKTLESEGLLV